VASVRFDRVSKRFGGTLVLDSVSLDVPDGEFWVILGPSGSGKSTVLRLVAGLEDASAGDIFIGDRRVNGLPPGERDVAFVFQSYALYPHLSVFENIAFPLRVAGMRRDAIRARVESVAGLLELSHLLNRRPRELSGGQRQRVAIGRAVVRQPQVFLFDEPLSNLDARLRATTRLELIALHRRLQTTVLYVTHDQEEAMTLGQRIAVVHESRLQQVGTPEDIYRRPRNLFVAGFIGSPRMNFLTGHLEDGRFRTTAGLVDVAPPVRVPGEITLGIRPDHVALAGAGAFGGQVDVVENLGREHHVHVRAGDARLTVVHRGPGAPKPGDDVRVTLDVDELHWFAKGDRVER
jgi:ABC-type sugar transport system ATPase subunit